MAFNSNEDGRYTLKDLLEIPELQHPPLLNRRKYRYVCVYKYAMHTYGHAHLSLLHDILDLFILLQLTGDVGFNFKKSGRNWFLLILMK